MNPRRRVLRLALLASGAPLLAACGFQRLGATRLSARLSAVYVDATDAFTPLYASLRQQLTAAGARFLAAPGGTGAVLHLQHEESGERIQTWSAQNAPLEIEAFYLVDFALILAGVERIAFPRVVATRSYSWDPTRVLGKAEEGRRVRQSLADELAARIVQHLGSLP